MKPVLARICRWFVCLALGTIAVLGLVYLFRWPLLENQVRQAIVKRLGCEEPPRVVDIESMRAESESTAAGFALDQQMSGKKAMRELGWS